MKLIGLSKDSIQYNDPSNLLNRQYIEKVEKVTTADVVAACQNYFPR